MAPTKSKSARAVPTSDSKRTSSTGTGANTRKSNSRNASGTANNTTTTNSQRNNSPPVLSAEDRRLQSLLGQGAYHLPGNGWCQDYIQYFCNNHPLIAPFCQHRLHPISKWMRAVGLLGSVMVGLVITNAVYLWFIHDNESTSTTVFEMSAGGFAVQNGTKGWVYLEEEDSIAQYTKMEVSYGMAILWTVGGALHAFWDSTIWYASSCACLSTASPNSSINSAAAAEEGRCCSKVQSSSCATTAKRLCNILVVTGVLLITAVATVAVVVRAHVEGGGEASVNSALDTFSSVGGSVGIGDSNNANTTTTAEAGTEYVSNKDNYEYLLAYSIELVVAWFIWFPLLETLMFSGITSRICPCGVGGGRPAELEREQRPSPGQRKSRNRT